MAKFRVKYLDGYDKEKTMTVEADTSTAATKVAMNEQGVCMLLEVARVA